MMNARRLIWFILALALLCSGCAAPAAVSAAKSSAPADVVLVPGADLPPAPSSEWQEVPNGGGMTPVESSAPAASMAPAESAAAASSMAPAAEGDYSAKSDSGRNYDELPEEAPLPEGSESYASEPESGFRSVETKPLSTFSVDVDTASYSNIRRYLNEGSLPPEDAVRIEEMINYFHYNYPEPQSTNPFALQARVFDCPWNRAHRLAVLGLKARSPATRENIPSNLVFLIDVSGSMADEDKLPLLKTAFSMLANELTEDDTVSIVAYAGTARVVLEPTDGTQKNEILRAIDSLSAGGSTAGSRGIQTAYRLAEKHFNEDGNNRIILATDGDFNVGVSDTRALEELITEKKESGIFLSVLGFGEGNLKDDKMETLADRGNGNYAYIDNISEAHRVLVAERSGTLMTIAKDVKLQVEFNPAAVDAYRLIGYDNRALHAKDFANDAKDAGDMGAGQTVTAVYEIIPAEGNTELRYQPAPGGEWMAVHLRYKAPQGDVSRELRQAVPQAAYTSNPGEDALFAAAVAEFGMLLKGSRYDGGTSYKNVLSLARDGMGRDEGGYRQEFIELVEQAYGLMR